MHKRLGILGGMTPESTVTYYQHIVRRYQQRYGDHGFPEIVIYSVSFQDFENWMEAGEWDRIGERLGQALRSMHAAGVEVAVIASNTMHLLFDRLQRESGMPLISIVETTAAAIERAHLGTVGLLGTRFTMEKPFYAEGLARHGIRTIVPDAEERGGIHRVIMDELSLGRLEPASRRRYVEIIERLAARGAEGVVLGCTEIPLLVGSADTRVPLFDTTILHAEAALEAAIGQ